MKGKAAAIDDYLARVSPEQGVALEKLRKIIRATAPKGEECISYQVPAFLPNGVLVGFGARSKSTYCAFFSMSGTTVAVFKDELEGFETGKGMIRFQPERPVRKSRVPRARLNDASG